MKHVQLYAMKGIDHLEDMGINWGDNIQKDIIKDSVSL
jgi:hypothetical protein